MAKSDYALEKEAQRAVGKWINSITNTSHKRLKCKLMVSPVNEDMWTKRYSATALQISEALRTLTPKKRKSFIKAIKLRDSLMISKFGSLVDIKWASDAPGYLTSQDAFKKHVGYVFSQVAVGFKRYPK